MKKMVFLMVFAVMSFAVNAQINEATAVLDLDKKFIQQKETLEYTVFTVKAGKDQADYMKMEAQKYAAAMMFEMIPTGTDTYTCKMGFNHKTFIENFHKMFVMLGITKIEVNGKLHPVNEMITMVKNY